jgi:hypothetical protein
MIVTEKEYRGMFKDFNGMTFTPEATLIVEKNEVEGVKEKIFTYEILKTVDEVYQDYLNPLRPEPTQDEILRSKILKDGMIMQLQLAKQQQINANLLAQIAKLGGTK